LIAKLGDEAGQCANPLVARPARLPAGSFHAFAEADENVTKMAQDLFNGLPSVAQQTADLKAEHPDWDEPPRVSIAHAGKAGFFLSAQNLGPAGCGEPGFYADALWRSPTGRAKGKWDLVRSPDEGRALLPVLIFADGTGALRIVYRGDLRMGVLHVEEGQLVVDRELEIPYLDCRC
jgi:hypothetical protein